jgi:TRAP-type transport system periplasmic protein
MTTQSKLSRLKLARTKLTRITLARAALAACMAAGSAFAFAQDKPVELKFAHWVPASHPLSKLGYEPWAKSIEEASKGSIKVTIYPAQQLGKAQDHYDMARDGIADITWVNPGYQAGRFPIFSAGELPFLMSNPGGGSAALDAWYRKYAEREMRDIRMCMAHLHQGSLHSKKAITEPSQIKGMKIRPANGTVAAFMSSLGATNVQVSAPEARDALEKGVADAITFPWQSIITFGVDKAVKFHTDFKLYQATFVFAINKASYDKLSANQKKVMDDHCTNAWAGKIGAAWGDAENAGQGNMEKLGGHTIVKVTPPQLAAWRKAANVSYDKWVADAGKAGINAQEALDGLRAELKKRNALGDK